MNTITRVRTLVRVMQAVARTILVIACGLALRLDTAHEAHTTVQAQTRVVQPAAVAAPAGATVVSEEIVLEMEQAAPEARPSKCGDLPRAPWNTCVALHDHEI